MSTAIEHDAQPKLTRKQCDKDLRKLPTELCRLQEWVKFKGLRVIVDFEGRDAADKGGTITAITERVSPCVFRLVALPAPSDREKSQLPRFEATVEACRLRLRPILMTSFAFILGVVPLVLAQGAGAEMRVALGVAVFSGMLGVAIFGLLFTPIFYSIIMKFSEKRQPAQDLE